MGLRQTLTRALERVGLIEQVNPMLIGGIDADDWKYRRLTGKSDKDLPQFQRDKLLRIAYWLYLTNPIARRILELSKEYVVGEGINFSAAEEPVQEVLEAHWNDPVNNWDLKQHCKILELGLYGEQIYPVFVNRVNGHVRLGYIDPLLVKGVKTDPDNIEIPLEIILKSSPGEPERVLPIIRRDEEPNSETFGRLVGGESKGSDAAGTFFFAINKVSNATRGVSDLACLADWLDIYDQTLFSAAERAQLASSFVWDVKLEGFNQEQIQGWLKSNPTPKPGSLRAHNEKVTWNAVSPDLKAEDMSRHVRTVRNQVLAGAGFPEHWFAEGGDVNRATALEMGDPTLKKLTARQRYFKHMIEHIFRFVIDQAVIAGKLSDSLDLSFEVNTPDMSVRDMAKVAAVLNQATAALVVARDNQWVTDGTARQIFATMAGQLGVEVDPAQEEKELGPEIAEARRRYASLG